MRPFSSTSAVDAAAACSPLAYLRRVRLGASPSAAGGRLPATSKEYLPVGTGAAESVDAARRSKPTLSGRLPATALPVVAAAAATAAEAATAADDGDGRESEAGASAAVPSDSEPIRREGAPPDCINCGAMDGSSRMSRSHARRKLLGRQPGRRGRQPDRLMLLGAGGRPAPQPSTSLGSAMGAFVQAALHTFSRSDVQHQQPWFRIEIIVLSTIMYCNLQCASDNLFAMRVTARR